MAPKKENPTVASINTLNEHLKSGEFNNIYLLTGTEGYFISQYKHKLLDALTTPDDTMNFNAFSGDKFQENSLIEAMSTMPFFSDHRTILVEATGILKKASDNLINAIEEIPDTTKLIFVETDTDSRLRIYKAIAKHGTVAKFETPDASMLNTWLKRILAQDGASVEDKAVFALINAVGNDMNRLYNEAAKLRAYTIDKKSITVEDVENLCENDAENKVFEMLDAIGDHNANKAISLYSDLEQLKVPSMQTLALVRKRYMQLAQIKMMLKEKEDNSTIARLTGIHPFYLKPQLALAEKYEYKTLLSFADMCSNADLDVKAGRSSDKAAVENLILKLCLS